VPGHGFAMYRETVAFSPREHFRYLMRPRYTNAMVKLGAALSRRKFTFPRRSSQTCWSLELEEENL